MVSLSQLWENWRAVELLCPLVEGKTPPRLTPLHLKARWKKPENFNYAHCCSDSCDMHLLNIWDVYVTL